MRIVFNVPAPDHDGVLTAVAACAWEDFNRSVANPLGSGHEVSYDPTSNALTAIAMSQPLFAQPSWPLPDRALFLLSEAILTKTPEGERRLTLLHECIHMDFAL
jgi:hypothetical protein